MLFDVTNITSGLAGGSTTLSVILLWTLFWKLVALWTSARRGHRLWFVLLLVLNTVGILEIVYIASFGREGKQNFASVIKSFFSPARGK